jgi:hypothetical protein
MLGGNGLHVTCNKRETGILIKIIASEQPITIADYFDIQENYKGARGS